MATRSRRPGLRRARRPHRASCRADVFRSGRRRTPIGCCAIAALTWRCSSVRRTSSASTAWRSCRPAVSRRRSAWRIDADCASASSGDARRSSASTRSACARALARDAAAVPAARGARRGDRAAADGLSDRRHGATALAEALASVLRGRRALLVASTDLSHYHDAATAARLDAVVIDCVSRFDADALQHALDVRPEHACGGGPTVAVMRAAALRRPRRGRARLRRLGRCLGRQVGRGRVPGGGIRNVQRQTPQRKHEDTKNRSSLSCLRGCIRLGCR